MAEGNLSTAFEIELSELNSRLGPHSLSISIRVPPVSLFSRAELAAAFGLLAPPDRATELATRWFDQFGGELDGEGRYVHASGWRRANGSPPTGSTLDWDSPEGVVRDEALLSTVDPSDIDDLLLRLGDLHLALVALTSEAAFERMRAARGMSAEQSARNRQQLTRGAVRAYRKRVGLPPMG